MDEIVRYAIKHEISNTQNSYEFISYIWRIGLLVGNGFMYINVSDINNECPDNDMRYTIFSKDNKILIDRTIKNYDGKMIFIKSNKLENCSKPLILMIEIIVDKTYVEILDETNKSEDKLNDLQVCRLKEFDDFEKNLNNEIFSDLTINVSGKTFHAHKMILSSKSPVFAAMFTHDVRENKENVVNIDDINPEVFVELLRFMYVAKIQNLKELADDLLPAADKYCLDGLKNICEKCIIEKLAINNAFHYIKLASLYNATNLKKGVIEFIKSNRLELNKLDENELKESFKNMDTNVFYEIVRALTST